MNARAEPPVLHAWLRPTRGWALPDLAELWRFRDLLQILVARDLKLRYRQTALGISWVVLQPLLAAAIFAFVFGKVARIQSPGGVPYFLFALAGMIAWTGFSSTLQRSGTSLLVHAHLVAKVWFPRLLLPLSAALASLIDLAVGLLLLAALLLLHHGAPGAAMLLLPVSLVLLLLLALGLGLHAAAIAVRYRDVQYVLPVATQLLLYGSPVAYPTQSVPAAYQTLYHLNPLVAPLETFRWALFGTGQTEPIWLAYSATAALLLCGTGLLLFLRVERTLSDVL